MWTRPWRPVSNDGNFKSRLEKCQNHCFSAYREKINMFRLSGVGYIRACPNFAMIFSRIKSAFLSINFRVRERNIFPTPQNIFVQDSFAFYRNKQRVMRSEHKTGGQHLTHVHKICCPWFFFFTCAFWMNYLERQEKLLKGTVIASKRSKSWLIWICLWLNFSLCVSVTNGNYSFMLLIKPTPGDYKRF